MMTKYLNNRRQANSKGIVIRGKKAKQKQDEGLALVIALLTGMMLIVGTTGLLVRQLTARKLGAAESYQQMAETAANNGLNRILSTLNDASGTYRGYLYTIDNKEESSPKWKWGQLYLGDQVCAGTNLPDIADKSGDNTNWPAGNYYPLEGSIQNLKGDGAGYVQTFYRLRGFDTDYTEGQGSGTFEIEGKVIRKDPDSNTEQTVARALLTRTLAIDSRIPNWDDWSVLASVGFGKGVAININGGGLFSPIISPLAQSTTINDIQDLCSDSTYNVSSNEVSPIVWPIVNPAGKVELPPTSIYDKDKSVDKIADKRRIWTFNDSDENGLQACGNRLSVYCTRSETNYDYQSGQQVSGIDVTSNANGAIPSGDIKTWRKIESEGYQIGTYKSSVSAQSLANDTSKIMIDPEKNSFNDDDWLWESVDLNAQDISLFYVDSTTGLPYIARCIHPEIRYCEPSDLIEKSWSQKLERFRFEKIRDVNYSHQISIPEGKICTEDEKSKSCHIYVENLNLGETEIFIENDSRPDGTSIKPTVLHLGDSGMKRRDDIEGYYKYELQASSKLCGADIESPYTCNDKPHRFVITANSSNNPGSCNASSRNDFTVNGESLPAAWISLSNDRVNLKNATIMGTIWADSVCNSGTTSLTSTDGSKQYVELAEEIWEWESIGFYGIGRRIIRGIRGSEYDIFRVW